MTARNRGTSLIGKLSCYITYIIVIHRDIVTTTWTHATFCPKAGAELEYTDCLNWIMTPPFTEWLGVWQWSKIRQIKKNYDFTYCTQKLFRSNSFPFFLFLQVEWKWKKKKIKTCSKIFIRWSTMHGGVSYLLEKSSNGCDGGTCPL